MRRFWTIVFPLLSPTSFFLMMVNIAYVSSTPSASSTPRPNGGPQERPRPSSTRSGQDGVVGIDLGGSAAQSVILMVIVIALTAIQFRFIERKVHYAEHVTW